MRLVLWHLCQEILRPIVNFYLLANIYIEEAEERREQAWKASRGEEGVRHRDVCTLLSLPHIWAQWSL